MAKQTKANQSKFIGAHLLAGWPIVAIVSILVNVALISTWVYLVQNRPLALESYARAQVCDETGYAVMMSNTDPSDKKYVAATRCFVDYETGITLDIESVKPLLNTSAVLPIKQ